MKGRSDIPFILDRLMSSKRLTTKQVLRQCASMRGGTMQPINFFKPDGRGLNYFDI